MATISPILRRALLYGSPPLFLTLLGRVANVHSPLILEEDA